MGMDVWEYTRGREPAEYQFRKNGVNIKGTSFYCDVGWSTNHDQVQGSKTILLKLSDNDEVDVVQLRDTDIADSRISFCGALIHLDKASESPGGLGADATWTDFPQSTALDLCENNATSTCLTGHEYESPTFEDLPTAEPSNMRPAPISKRKTQSLMIK